MISAAAFGLGALVEGCSGPHAASASAALVYRFDDGPELIETIRFADTALPASAGREAGFAAALRLLHLIAGIVWMGGMTFMLAAFHVLPASSERYRWPASAPM